ncbi:coatomer epsilon subunit-domain-containing protein [Gorgonomyces haynaldii]|nr:coatomer epsilon subunit-domain-containing protein [Gorgonomyces haynaldii]
MPVLEQEWNRFYIGDYEQLIQILKSSTENMEQRKQLMFRTLLVLGQYQTVVNQISERDSSELLAIQLVAKYHLGDKIQVTEEAKQFLRNHETTPVVSVAIGTVLYEQDLLEDALVLVSKHPRDLECVGLAVQTLLKMNRLDLAQQQIQQLKTWADDAPLAQLIETWPALYSAQADQFQQAFYVYEELIAFHAHNPKLLTGQAVCQMHRGFYEEAESLLKMALHKNSSNVDALANMIVCSSALLKSDVAQQCLSHLSQVAPSHPLVVDLQTKDVLFDRAAVQYN